MCGEIRPARKPAVTATHPSAKPIETPKARDESATSYQERVNDDALGRLDAALLQKRSERSLA